VFKFEHVLGALALLVGAKRSEAACANVARYLRQALHSSGGSHSGGCLKFVVKRSEARQKKFGVRRRVTIFLPGIAGGGGVNFLKKNSKNVSLSSPSSASFPAKCPITSRALGFQKDPPPSVVRRGCGAVGAREAVVHTRGGRREEGAHDGAEGRVFTRGGGVRMYFFIYLLFSLFVAEMIGRYQGI
jgi:hypothetical protein